MSLGDRVRRARRAKELTQLELVVAVRKRGGDLSQPQLSAIEKGDVERPGCLPELAAVLGMTAAELLGKPAALRPARDEIEIPVSSHIGAGDQVVDPVEGDPPIYYVKAPPEVEDGEATEVRGRSMLPAYEPGDVLFYKRTGADPREMLGRLVVAKLVDGRRYVKVLQSGRRGRFTLASLNPAYDPMEDQAIEWAARIIWVKKAAGRKGG